MIHVNSLLDLVGRDNLDRFGGCFAFSMVFGQYTYKTYIYIYIYIKRYILYTACIRMYKIVCAYIIIYIYIYEYIYIYNYIYTQLYIYLCIYIYIY